VIDAVAFTILNPFYMNPFQLLARVFAVASFYTLINLVTVSQPLPPCLERAGFYLSVALIPLSVHALLRWPDITVQKMWRPHAVVFLASSTLFVVGMFYLISYFGQGAAFCTGLAGLIVCLCIGIQWWVERQLKK
jgi:hypothetical protein